MNFTNTDLVSIYNSRRTLIEILLNSRYVVSSYDNFNINEVEAMAKNNQLDMLLSKTTVTTTSSKRSLYVKYMLSKTAIRLQAIDDLIEELYEIEGVLSKKDTLIIVVNDEPNDSMIMKLRYLFDNRGIYVVVHNIKRLQRNILKHGLVPQHTLVDDIEQLKLDYNLKDLSQLPEISRFDPVALLIELRPGQVCKIDRKSITSSESTYYRICV
jgi:DNA-directed RNA polymerase subunit H (RpoH/RPB5)